MSSRFQKEDEIDREVKQERRTDAWLIPLSIIFFAVIFGLSDWLRGQSLKSFWEELGGTLAIGFIYWLVHPIYDELRIRTREIYGKVSAIESATKEPSSHDKEILNRIHAIEGSLNEIYGEFRKANADSKGLNIELGKRLKAIEDKMGEIKNDR